MVEAWILFVTVGIAAVLLIVLVVVVIRQNDQGDEELIEIQVETKRQVHEATLESRRAISAMTGSRALRRQLHSGQRRQWAERDSKMTERQIKQLEQPLTGPDLGEDVPDDPPAA